MLYGVYWSGMNKKNQKKKIQFHLPNNEIPIFKKDFISSGIGNMVVQCDKFFCMSIWGELCLICGNIVLFYVFEDFYIFFIEAKIKCDNVFFEIFEILKSDKIVTKWDWGCIRLECSEFYVFVLCLY